ncbi:hypothetical protein TSMEX_008025 [Taenia solium]|eukprot:TsM_000152000 transcript=TsM_000152000 gene=TsM_000152000
MVVSGVLSAWIAGVLVGALGTLSVCARANARIHKFLSSK